MVFLTSELCLMFLLHGFLCNMPLLLGLFFAPTAGIVIHYIMMVWFTYTLYTMTNINIFIVIFLWGIAIIISRIILDIIISSAFFILSTIYSLFHK